MNIPANLLYTSDHEWVRIEGNTAYVGITDFAQSELGELVYIEVETFGEQLGQGEQFGTVEAVKTTSELYMPLSGTILEFNSELDSSDGDNPVLINEDPYGKGWIVKIELSDPSEAGDLLSAAAYEAEIK